MELREWLIILGLALVSLIVVDGVRRLQRQRRVPRLDQAVDNLPKASRQELDDEAREAEVNWELPNGGARVVKPADYSGLGKKPKLERQEHPGPSRVLSDFRRSFSKAAARSKSAIGGQRMAYQGAFEGDAPPAFKANSSPRVRDTERLDKTREKPAVEKAPVEKAPVEKAPVEKAAVEKPVIEERREPSLFADEPVSTAPVAEPSLSAVDTPALQASAAETPDPVVNAAPDEPKPVASASDEIQPADNISPAASEAAPEAPASPVESAEPVLRAEPGDAAFTKTGNAPKRRQLRSNTAGELGDDEIDEYKLVDFEGMGRSFKRRLIERRQERARKKAEKAERAKALAKQKAERKALEAEQRREAKQAAEAEKARLAQEHTRAREVQAASATRFEDDELYSAEPSLSALRRRSERDERDVFDAVDDHDERFDEQESAYFQDSSQDSVVRVHPTLEKALRHDVSGTHAKETLTHASEMVVISVLSREEEGFDGSKLLELMMACGLRYSRTMGVFHRFETESHDSELQFSMLNVVKPGTFPIEEMGEFATPGITLLMPLPGAIDTAAAFEAMVETAMVVVRHMGGELKDENHSVMTAQTIEFARQRVHEFERRHRLQRHTAR
ncbi:cell division protein ZipA C-terminal FtsZ-binding domain-containing protein [Vreelandella malpeensis]|uniref:Cell division protein ZipA n=1 Tax=Vreelandella malpeensis TaxID=1172368 RepID=A0ABS8DS41_9GAMM|nr:cell division protein ZipA C-terminal FtsZ-binding domain-containing protein [Halomonas malpeensis]MCB8888915.1 cell division protein ZipA [Halomonas malpeensis]